jgi:streptogramin lyase
MRHFLWQLTLALVLGFGALVGLTVDAHAQGEAYLVEYDVPGSPLNVAVEAAGRIWYTLPDEGEIGLLLPAGNSGDNTTYSAGNGSEPYDLAVRQGTVWFTDRALNRIGAFDISDETFKFYAAPANSAPTAIAIMPNGLVWFVESATPTLTVLDPAANGGNGAFTRYPYSQNNGELGDIAITNNRTVWLTIPNRNEIAAFDVPSEQFQIEQTSGPPGTPIVQRPLGITVDRVGRPWMTIFGDDANPSLIARYAPATTFRVRTTATGSPNAGPAQIAFYDAGELWYLFYSESKIGKVARLAVLPDGAIGGTVEADLGAASASPWGVAVDADGQAWFAVSGKNTLAGWQPPYSDWENVYMPIVNR